MKNVRTLESGNNYNLREFFSPEFTIAIPDLQRDYCWGTETYNSRGIQQGELVGNFVESLFEKADNEKIINMGLIYGYEWPKGTYQLCDGQQRITTIYLLAGELYKRLSDNENLRNVLKGILQKHDSTDPEAMPSAALQYSIRESTLYFIDDLVDKYFLDDTSAPLNFNNDGNRNDSKLKDSGRPAWYFLEYDNDPTIQSMLGALQTIRKNLADKTVEELTKFASALTDRLKFIYYDMGNRLRGEETFVVINTTGEPLTATENLKPLLLGEVNVQKYVDEWEEREHWFWLNRRITGTASDELSSDELSCVFYTWWIRTEDKKEQVDLLKDFKKKKQGGKLIETLDKIQRFFIALKNVLAWILKEDNELARRMLIRFSEWSGERLLPDFKSEQTLITWFRTGKNDEILLPLAMYYCRFGNIRLFDMLRRLVKNQLIGKSVDYKDGTEIRPYCKHYVMLKIVDEANTADEILENPAWYNHDEIMKMLIFGSDVEALMALELDENLRFDLNVVWNAGATDRDSAVVVAQRLRLMHSLAIGMRYEDYVGEEQPQVSEPDWNRASNHYRTLRMLKRWGGPFGKQWYINGRYWGMNFSKDEYPENLGTAYLSTDFQKLLGSETPLEAIKAMMQAEIRQRDPGKLFSESVDSSQGWRIMEVYLIGKMLINEPGGNILSNYAGNVLAADMTDATSNLLNVELPPTPGNFRLGYVRTGGYANDYSIVLNDAAWLDSPLACGILEKVERNISTEDIGRVEKELTERAKQFLE